MYPGQNDAFIGYTYKCIVLLYISIRRRADEKLYLKVEKLSGMRVIHKEENT